MPRDIDRETEGMSPSEKWEYIYGTDRVGRIPEYKPTKFIGKSYAPCPYSTQSTDLRTKLMLNIEDDTMPDKTDHSVDGVVYYMRTYRKGRWGFECTFDNCPYYLQNGKRYFYS